MLEQIGTFNDLSPKLRESLEKKIKSFGKKISYRFNISHENPDPEKYNGPIVWPFIYTLDPAVFRIQDPDEKRENKSKTKQIAMVNEVDEKGIPKSYHKIRVLQRHEGVFDCNLETEDGSENPDGIRDAMFLELHPKLAGGQFQNKTQKPIFSRIDETADADANAEKRKARLKAINAAMNMSDQQVRDFAAAMLWDDKAKIRLLKDKVEDLAEKNPTMFTDLIHSKNVEYQSMIKRALDKQVIAYDPVEYTFLWGSTQQPFAQMSPDGGSKNHVEKLAEWLQINGSTSEEVYKKIKSLEKV